MPEPIITASSMTWDLLDDTFEGGSSLPPGQLEIRGGKLSLAERVPDHVQLGPEGWLANQDSLVSTTSGASIAPGIPAYDVTAPDNAAYKLEGVAAGDKKTYSRWKNFPTLTNWMVHTFWFYDEHDAAVSRRWGLGVYDSGFNPDLMLMRHPGHPTLPSIYMFVSGFSGWASGSLTANLTISTGITAAPGWHFVMIAGVVLATGEARRVLILDNFVNYVTGLTADFPDGNAVGGLWTGDYTTKRLYFDSMKSWNQKRYPNAGFALFPHGRPQAVKAYLTTTQVDDTTTVDNRGTIDWFYQTSGDGGTTFGPYLTLVDASLVAEAPGFDGQDAIRPVCVIATTSAWLTESGLVAPTGDQVVITYSGGWAEETDDSPTQWTEE